MEGWIKLHRKFSEWEWADDAGMVSLFIHLLIMASPTDTEWHGQPIQRGQLITSVGTLAKKTGLTTQSIRTRLDRLKKSKNLTIESTSKYTIVTICNYVSYQDVKETSNKRINKQITNEQQTNNKQITTSKEYKNEENDKNINISPLTPLWVERISAFGFTLESEFEKYGECVADWLKYKKGKKQAYKTQDSFNALVKKLDRLAGGNPEKARLVIEESMAQNWAGLFEIEERQQTAANPDSRIAQKIDLSTIFDD